MPPDRPKNAALSLVLTAIVLLSMTMAAVSLSTAGHARTGTTSGGIIHSSHSVSAPGTANLLKLLGEASIHNANSGNWAGYVNTVPTTARGSIYEVTSEWYTPTVTCGSAPSGGSYQVSWVGIDGYGTGTVEQVGTLSYCSTTGATPGYYSWWEFAPYNSVQLYASISGGDFVQAYVLYNPAACVSGVCGIYTLSFADLSAGTSFSVTGDPATCNSSGFCEGGVDGSAECISEAPSGFGYSGITPVADYKSTTFYACADTIGSSFAGIGAHYSPNTMYKVTQVGASSLVDQKPGGLTKYYYGDTFSVTWSHYS
jgi:hypothetical protein